MAEDDTPRERFGENLKSPYPDSEGTFWDDLLETVASEVEELESTRQNVLQSMVVEEATGKQLEKIGKLVQLPRNTGETDPHYRGRLKVELRKFTGGATIQEIKDIAAILLRTTSGEVKIQEDFDVEAARFIIQVWSEDLNSAGVTVQEFKSFIDEVRGAGINTLAQERGTFTYRSEQEFINGVNDPSKGYYDPNDSAENGTYAGLL